MHARPCTGDAGLTLVEVLVTIAILGVLFAGLIGAMGGMVTSSALHRRQADVGAVVRTAAEVVNATPYVSCVGHNLVTTYAAAPGFATISHPPNVGAPTVVAVTKLDGTTSLAGCGTDPDLQMVQVQAVSADGKTSEQLWVVKANR